MSQQEAIRAQRPDVEREPPGVPMRQRRGRLVRQRASDARTVRQARRIALRRAKAARPRSASAALAAAPRHATSAVIAAPRPRLDAAVIGRYCRQAFPVALADGAFDDLLAMIEQVERHGARPSSVDATLGAPTADS